ncbi:MAG TPA: D-tyrosyl-tRNA(Tyr) deacylase [Candidatus Omnitrophica bacterium]|nr:D-tyrosyl-tRNA(Tyr) deacylase [Candidatus Omnitrophota bacterium]
MRALLQRVKRAKVSTDQEVISQIGYGLCVLLGAGEGDGDGDIAWLADKIVNLRIFEDEAGKLNKSIVDIAGEILLVSQFTLYADCRRGRRPSFDKALNPPEAEELFNRFFDYISKLGIRVKKGRFRALMEIELVNHGPVTIFLDSSQR